MKAFGFQANWKGNPPLEFCPEGLLLAQRKGTPDGRQMTANAKDICLLSVWLDGDKLKRIIDELENGADLKWKPGKAAAAASNVAANPAGAAAPSAEAAPAAGDAPSTPASK